MENKKQLKAQLTNEISKRYKDRIKELEDSRNALRTKLEIERKQFRELQEKYLNLAQELESLKDWYRPNGTGRIYWIEFGLNESPKLVYKIE